MKTLLIEIGGLIGAACVAAGVYWIYEPAGLITLGVLLLAASIKGAKRWAL